MNNLQFEETMAVKAQLENLKNGVQFISFKDGYATYEYIENNEYLQVKVNIDASIEGYGVDFIQVTTNIEDYLEEDGVCDVTVSTSKFNQDMELISFDCQDVKSYKTLKGAVKFAVNLAKSNGSTVNHYYGV